MGCGLWAGGHQLGPEVLARVYPRLLRELLSSIWSLFLYTHFRAAWSLSLSLSVSLSLSLSLATSEWVCVCVSGRVCGECVLKNIFFFRFFFLHFFGGGRHTPTTTATRSHTRLYMHVYSLYKSDRLSHYRSSYWLSSDYYDRGIVNGRW